MASDHIYDAEERVESLMRDPAVRHVTVTGADQSIRLHHGFQVKDGGITAGLTTPTVQTVVDIEAERMEWFPDLWDTAKTLSPADAYNSTVVLTYEALGGGMETVEGEVRRVKWSDNNYAGAASRVGVIHIRDTETDDRYRLHIEAGEYPTVERNETHVSEHGERVALSVIRHDD
jgi:hypothetical protein